MPRQSAAKVIPIMAFVGALGPFSIDAYLPALPEMAADLGAGPGMAQWTIAAYLIGVAVFPLFLAPLSDAFGRKPVMRAGLAGFALASVACAFAWSIEAMLALRLAQAACGGVAMAATRAVLADLYRGDELSRAMSYLMILFTAAPVIAPVVGAQLMVFGGWRAVFWLLAGFGVAAFLVCGLLEETLTAEKRRPYRARRIVRSYADAMTSRAALGHLATTFWSAVFFFAMLSAAPFIYIDHFGASPTAFSLIFAAISAVAFAANYVNARLVMRRGYRAMLRDSARFVGLLALLMAALAATGWGGIAGVVFVMIWLMGAFHVLNASTTAGIMDAMGDQAGAAAASLAFWRFMGGAIGAAGVGMFGSTHPWTFAAMLGLGAAGMLAAWPLVRRAAEAAQKMKSS